MSAWFLLLGAIATEVMGTTCLKLSQGLTRTWPVAGVVAFYAVSVVLLALALRTLDVGVAYAIWAGLGIALIALIGIVFLGEPLTTGRIASLGLIITGVVGLQLSGPMR